MDSLIRFCFGIDPEAISRKCVNDNYTSGKFEPGNAIDEYCKLYHQAKWVADYTTLTKAREIVHG